MTDGSFAPATGRGGYGVCVLEPRSSRGGSFNAKTSTSTEFVAATEGLKEARKFNDSSKIWTDSQAVLDHVSGSSVYTKDPAVIQSFDDTKANLRYPTVFARADNDHECHREAHRLAYKAAVGK